VSANFIAFACYLLVGYAATRVPKTIFELVLLVSRSHLILLAIMTTKTKNKAIAANVPLSTKITVRIKPILAARSIGRFLGLSARRSETANAVPV